MNKTLQKEIEDELAKVGILEWVDVGVNSFISLDKKGNEYISEKDIFEMKKHISTLAKERIKPWYQFWK